MFLGLQKRREFVVMFSLLPHALLFCPSFGHERCILFHTQTQEDKLERIFFLIASFSEESPELDEVDELVIFVDVRVEVLKFKHGSSV